MGQSGDSADEMEDFDNSKAWWYEPLLFLGEFIKGRKGKSTLDSDKGKSTLDSDKGKSILDSDKVTSPQ